MAAVGGGPVGALRRLLVTGLSSVQTRLQLVGNEIQVEKHRALQALMRVVLAAFCLCTALALGTVLVLVVWWDQRVAVLGTLIVVFLMAAAWLAQSVRRASAEHEHPFAASVAELQHDLQQLKAAARGAQEPR